MWAGHYTGPAPCSLGRKRGKSGARQPQNCHTAKGMEKQQKPESMSGTQRAAISRALADPRRFAILQQIASQQAMPCGHLQEHCDLSPATISHHLKELQQAGLIVAHREGRGMRLELCRDVWTAYLQALSSL